MGTKGYSILIVEDEVIVAENIANILRQQGYNISGIASNGTEAELLFKQRMPHLIMCDVNLEGEESGIQLISRLKADIPVIYLTAYRDSETVSHALATSPAAYLIKPFADFQLVVAVRLALESHYPSGEKTEQPTPREREVLKWLAKGFSSKQLAEKMCISEYTANTHRRNLLQKYKASSAGELVAMALNHRWISREE